MGKLRNSANAPLILWTWDGDAMKPLPRFAKLCDRDFVIGETYRMETVEERSHVSHSHYFAEVNEAWKNLPEGAADRFATPDHLRKFALIKCGYYDERSIALGTKAEAQHVASFVRPVDEYAIVTVSECVVTVYTAKSQSYRSMPKGEFQKSKTAVLEYLSSMLGVESEELKQAGRAA